MDSRDGNESQKDIRKNIEIEEVPASSAHSGEDFPASGSNQLPTLAVEVDDGSGSSKNSGLVDDNGGGSSEELDTHNEEIGRSSNTFEITPQFLQWWETSNHAKLQPNVVHESESSKQLEKNQENNNIAVSELLFRAKILRSSSSSSSSSSNTNKDMFQESKSLNPESGQPTDASGFSHESTAMESPPIQVMDRSEGYDPCRIPASVFQTSASSTPMDWSGASNDSVFSINVDSSFTKDPLRHRDPLESGEFLPFSPSMTGYSPYLISPSTEANKINNSLESKADKASPTTSDAKLASSNQNELKTKNTTESRTSSNVSTHSSSMNSTHSFAFPILMDAASKDSLKGEPPELQQQQQQQQQQRQQQQQHHPAQEVTLKPLTRKSWFSWCCCSPRQWTCSCHCCPHRPRYCRCCCCYR